MVRGRKPLASEVKERSGAYKKDPQRRNKKEPKPKAGIPEASEVVKADDIAGPYWIKICNTLDELGTLATCDYSLLEQFVLNYSQWIRLHKLTANANITTINVQGNVVATPEAIQVHKYADRHLKMLAELGLTPSSRSRLQVVKEEEEDAFGEYLARLTNSDN